MQINEIVPILEISVGPVILISGVGLILLSLTNRYGRVIDRSRVLADILRKTHEDDHHVLEQLQILLGRAKLLRSSITFASTSVLFAAVLVIGIFIGSLIHIDPAEFIVVMFSACLISLIISLSCFINDVNRSLNALDLDMEAITVPASKEAR